MSVIIQTKSKASFIIPMSGLSDKSLQTAQKNREIIRANFQYLISTFGFEEEPESKSDAFYSEVRYTKNDWVISIKTTAHGTKISLRLISPQGDFGLLSLLFQLSDKTYMDAYWNTKDITANIRLNSDYLSRLGQPILKGDPIQLKETLDTLLEEHKKWLPRSGAG